MDKRANTYILSAGDLSGHLGCRRVTELNRAVADGLRSAPPPFSDPMLEALIERGRRHEQAFVESLRAAGTTIVEFKQVGASDTVFAQTLAAMQQGVDVIVQGALAHGAWLGRPDILRRIEAPSGLGGWSYEVLDTKLARETTGATVLQLCLYADLVAEAQKKTCEHVYAITPSEDSFAAHPFRVDAYAAFYRRVKRELEAIVAEPTLDTYPDPVPLCESCRWFQTCDKRRRDDDHLSFVAGLGKTHIHELHEHGLDTLASFAQAPSPLPWKPKRGAVETYETLKRQAAIQFKGRIEAKPVYELLPIEPGLGLARLPQPSPGDVFLDLEGDPFAGLGGLEYLFGYVIADAGGALVYSGAWAGNRAQEKTGFEAFIDFVLARLKLYPDLHIFHYGAYEASTFKRLMGRHATRENELDGLLRSERFVDLLSVVRNGVRASVESYSIKKLEPFYGYHRIAPLLEANRALARVQAALELDKSLSGLGEDCAVVAAYNEDDCRSTAALRDWLEARRSELLAAGVEIDRPSPKPPEASPNLSARMAAAEALASRLLDGVPVDTNERSPDEQARWLLAQSLSWHRREDKATWWEFFRRAALSGDELLDEKSALSGLVFDSVVEAGDAPVHRYRFPEQETELREDARLCETGGADFGTVRAISAGEYWLDIKKRKDTANRHPAAVFELDFVNSDVMADALMRIGADIADHGFAGSTQYPAASALLLRTPPSPSSGVLQHAHERPDAAACRLMDELASGILAIQGPPGAGKTYTGAHMIAHLVAAGKTVGVTANSHKVITHLLEEAIKAAVAQGVAIACVQKTNDAAQILQPGLRTEKSNDKVRDAIGVDANVAGATAWFWARSDLHHAVDVLFVDEAAQMSLANVLAVSQAAKTVVLLGDPRQLEQPSKGAHPEGAEDSALDHVLGGAQTIGDDQGLFLGETWRLHPDICAFSSELFYENRLTPRADLATQTILSSGPLQGVGLRHLVVAHSGNQNSAIEEVEAIKAVVDATLAGGSTWVDRFGVARQLSLDDILIVAPYNAQVFALQHAMPSARIGTVDKFQGQEAPIVIYSMTSSSSADAPRGMEFLYSLNRLNVATSRARCLCIIVATPALFEADCRSPRQMQLANALCRYKELATLLV